MTENNFSPATLTGILKDANGTPIGNMTVVLNGVPGEYNADISTSILESAETSGTVETAKDTKLKANNNNVKANNAADEIDPFAVAARLRALRELGGYTQEDIAADLFTNARQISLIETCDRSPSLYMLTMYRKLFGVSIDFLLFGEKLPSQCISNEKKRSVLQLAEKLVPKIKAHSTNRQKQRKEKEKQNVLDAGANEIHGK